MLMQRFLGKLARSWTVITLAVALSAPALGALPTFDSGSTGADGALDFSSAEPGTTIEFNPADFDPPLDPENDNVYHFTTITIPADVTVRLSARVLGSIPVVWLASGAVVIDGILDLNGETGPAPQAGSLPAMAGAGGYGGGAGSTTLSPAQPGNGLGGGGPYDASGCGGQSTAGAGSAGHAVDGSGPRSGAAYGNEFLLPLTGGSGGAGGGGIDCFSNGSGGGGAGGGALLVASSESILVDGAIKADGGDGGEDAGISYEGGGGSGGAVRLIAPVINGTGTLSADSGDAPDSSGTFGSPGRIRLETFQYLFAGTFNRPRPSISTPGLVFLPPDATSLRVVSVAGVPIPAAPTGSFVTPDLTLNDVVTATIEIEAQDIPLGTVVQVTLLPETGSPQTVDSTPLAGTQELSTATATVTIPHGFTRFFVQANWTP